MLEMNAIVSGNVQGVGFRASVKSLAESVGVVGFVRNLENGSVEICAQGQKENLDQLLELIKKQFSDKYLQAMKIVFCTPQRQFKEFCIEH